MTTADPLVDALQRRRAAAIAEARRGATRDASGETLFMHLYAADQCDRYLTLLDRLGRETA